MRACGRAVPLLVVGDVRISGKCQRIEPIAHSFFFFCSWARGSGQERGPEGVTSSSGLTSQLSPDPRQLLGLTRPPIPRGTVGRRHVLTVLPVEATKAKRPEWDRARPPSL